MSKELRIATIDPEKCKPKKCNQECKRSCPVVKIGKLCVVVSKKDKVATISEELCNGCGICTKKCPFSAIKIINLPSSLTNETVHRYSQNGFKLHGLPILRQNQVLGLIGKNGIGKSTAIKILSGKILPNLGDYKEKDPDRQNIINHFKGSEMQLYLEKVYDTKIKFKTAIKAQYIDSIPKYISGSVRELLELKNERGNLNEIIEKMDLKNILDKDIVILSGGELQRFAISLIAIQDVDAYMFDEPSSYLDVKQRLNAASVIKSLKNLDNKYIICVEHDLTLLDFLSDTVCILYGEQSAYGVVSLPSSTVNGINIFLSGYIPSANMRFRKNEINFKFSSDLTEINKKKMKDYTYPDSIQTYDNFKLTIQSGSYKQSEITVLLGENGTGKTTFIRMLAKMDNSVSYKPQIIKRNFDGTVRELLQEKIKNKHIEPQFKTEVYNVLNIEPLLELSIQDLSGGELQRVSLCLCLGKDADIYLIDEPSAYLDCEHRLEIAKMIKRFIIHNRKTAFVVEHDFIFATYLADSIILFTGEPSKETVAESPTSLLEGMNNFLKQLDITFRRDKDNWRPRINKKDSVKDTEQKKSGNYFFMDND